jgi:membrane-associated phospholipid phosphatase
VRIPFPANRTLIDSPATLSYGHSQMRSFQILLSVILLVSAAHTQPVYKLEPKRDGLLLGSGFALTVGGLIAYNNVRPLTLDEINALDRSNINRFDRGAVGPYRSGLAANMAVGFSLALPLTLLSDRRIRQEWRTIGVMWGEVILLQSGLNAIVKSLAGRVRPYAYDPGTPMSQKTEADARVSFYSSHTGTSAAMSFLAARLFSGYFPHSHTRNLVWGAAVVYPALIGMDRIRSGRHYPSDVIVGYVTGAAIGYFVPALHKSKATNRISVESRQIGGSPAVCLAWRF